MHVLISRKTRFTPPFVIYHPKLVRLLWFNNIVIVLLLVLSSAIAVCSGLSLLGGHPSSLSGQMYS